MAASRGVDNWNDNFKGQGDISTVAKVDTGILYEENGNRSTQQLTRGTPVTYIDSESKSHTRVAIRINQNIFCLLYTSPSPRDRTRSRMPSSA